MPAQVDFYSQLSGLGKQIAEMRKETARRQAFEDINNPDGTVDFNKAIMGLTRAGDLEGAARISQIKNATEDRARQARLDARQIERDQIADTRADRQFNATQAYQNATLGLQRRAAERADERAEVPAGFERNPGGGLRPTPGGPQDPKYIESAATSKASGKSKDLPFNVVKELNERGGSYGDLARLNSTFDDSYGGYKLEKAGDIANFAARNLGIGNEAGATWWQDYQTRKNLVRNQLFGSALTATEKAEFDKANINPGMTPKAIRENLAIQERAAKAAATKLAGTYAKMGYNSEQIEAALGVPLSDVGVAAKGGAAPKPTTTGPTSPSREIPKAAIDALKADPSLKDQFEAKYGLGTAGVVLR